MGPGRMGFHVHVRGGLVPGGSILRTTKLGLPMSARLFSSTSWQRAEVPMCVGADSRKERQPGLATRLVGVNDSLYFNGLVMTILTVL